MFSRLFSFDLNTCVDTNFVKSFALLANWLGFGNFISIFFGGSMEDGL